jgi:hypothetical protein
MNSNPHNPNVSDSDPHTASRSGDETLRLIASLPAPAGLENRVHAALRAAENRGPQLQVAAPGAARQARILAWPRRLNQQKGWMRTAAAAAIVFVVVGGGWGVYTRVEHNQPAKVIVMPARMPVVGGFSSAGAMRTPQTLPGPMAPQQQKALHLQPKKPKKPVATLSHESSAVPAAPPGNSATQNDSAK